jgi:chromosome segregation ATPase
MSALKSAWWVFGAGLVTVIALRTTATAGQSAAATPDTMSALLQEVHDLRVAMEQMASAGPRVQLAIGRLQLQEQRVNTLVRRADELHESVANQQQQLAEVDDRIATLQRALEGNAIPNEERTSIEYELPKTRTQKVRLTQELQRLQAEEADAAAQVANEQARWVEINQRLEELERSLTRR